MKIEYYSKEVYGNTLHYIAVPAIAQTIAYLTKKKTITLEDMLVFKNLGIEFVRVQNPAHK